MRSLNSLDDIGQRTARLVAGVDGRTGRDVLLTPSIIEHITPSLQYLRDKCRECELGTAASRIEDRIFPRIKVAKMTFEDLLNQISELRLDIDKDLEYRRFIYVQSEKARVLDDMVGQWSDIWARIPCERDVRDATLSYAMGLNTAAVFHSMRVAEAGLRALAKKMKISILDKGKKVPIDYGTWEKVITACNNKIADARKLPGDARKERQLQYYSRAADHCTYMKDIWRNEVSHSRKSYIEPEARAVLDRVHAFMEFFAAGTK
jgi:hypothetical protein